MAIFDASWSLLSESPDKIIIVAKNVVYYTAIIDLIMTCYQSITQVGGEEAECLNTNLSGEVVTKKLIKACKVIKDRMIYRMSWNTYNVDQVAKELEVGYY